ncbi:ribosome maturation factor RimM [Fluoribacter dumoffii]|uniref:Ribosome maturation factor RimM n=1 Tax=Fluoribacter dumoffii TaxID=463 RepID=A0A377GDT6_9GAMM|nr:ribosome maturation factor RimM [Fluoribacter dumoffii]KTC90794.1 16S rRNA-processing protein RimM [Fluoribacter dumoffii NY 23]MCW8386637.1 ribosome maturation factor RimM [Fluoribacter dumoffii]MCW8419691.1 ribosome maturation factor RimM [Fluoribacter dumoffii]MCW8455606.1 ribosome maturation factor RimM [Fluoribacter dumoffii]MCW8460315.1 ribosome maturation factor RimM [Fluoribacter dumoffii]
MNSQANWIVIARFGRPHGIKGFVTVHSFTEPRDNVLKYANWHAFINNKWQPIKLTHAEVQNKSIIVQVEGYPERESVACLTNIEIAVQQEQLETLKPGEYYWHQLIGMKVINQQGELFGNVTEIIPTGANDVLVIEGNKRHLIPYLPGQFILDIDSNRQIITVDWDVDF